jgi:hypothetical protein
MHKRIRSICIPALPFLRPRILRNVTQIWSPLAKDCFVVNKD